MIQRWPVSRPPALLPLILVLTQTKTTGYAFSDAANGVAAQLTNYTDGTISQTGQVILNKLKSRAMAKRSMRYPIPRGFAEFDLTDA